MANKADSEMVTFSFAAISARCFTMSAAGMRRKSNRWHRDRIVGNTFSGSVVANMNFTCSGGSSRVFNNALKASFVSM